jgi:chorismate dehydratase
VLFGKIDYINLLPFYIFIKRYVRNSQTKQSINYKKSFPSKINRDFKRRAIDAAFISSIESKRGNFRSLDIGIIAKGEIQSVILKEGVFKPDSHSATSNQLAHVLKLNGEVIIGDKALKAYLQTPHEYIDLAKEWKKRTNLPFVFARLCVNRNYSYYNNLSKNFLKTKIRIPQYIKKKYIYSRQIDGKDIDNYLSLVSYNIDKNAKQSLKKFLKAK